MEEDMMFKVDTKALNVAVSEYKKKTTQEIADEVGISLDLFNQLLSGEKNELSLNEIKKIAGHFEVTVGKLIVRKKWAINSVVLNKVFQDSHLTKEDAVKKVDLEGRETYIMHRHTFDKALDGETNILHIDTIYEIAQKFNIPMKELLAEPGSTTASQVLALKDYIKNITPFECNALWKLLSPVINQEKTMDEVLTNVRNSSGNQSQLIQWMLEGEQPEVQEKLINWVCSCQNEKLDGCFHALKTIHSLLLTMLLEAKGNLNALGYKQLQEICLKLAQNPLYFGDPEEKTVDGSIAYLNEGEGAYTLFVLIPREIYDEYQVDPIENLYVEGIESTEGSPEWEDEIREAILEYLDEVDINDEMLFYDFRELFDSNIYDWPILEMTEDSHGPFAPENMSSTKQALENLIIKMALDINYKEIGRIFTDVEFANEMFKKYGLESPFLK
jgi:DNA-binding Xre family transcriptional regulator